ncbi:DUF6892 domain-containing protein [Clostridium beijerinckii]|uniref:DUF6892 domain-containing protein n=1 Tax=Clostridium beijerinckii TaxID=1520 RepID=UPI000809CA81|nr:hypothetical protein [Clostridium beijerinckii]OCA98719.1 hypothetical protein BGS1_22820 [Clostridium beijerinckii]
MERYTDKCAVFEDFNFKLVVIDALLDKNPSFDEELKALIEEYTENYEWYSDEGPIKEILEFFAQLNIEKKDLDKITELCFDGGNEIYGFIQPDWDGEDDYFDVKSVKGFEVMENLKSVNFISMVEEEVLQPMKKQGIVIE